MELGADFRIRNPLGNASPTGAETSGCIRLFGAEYPETPKRVQQTCPHHLNLSLLVHDTMPTAEPHYNSGIVHQTQIRDGDNLHHNDPKHALML